MKRRLVQEHAAGRVYSYYPLGKHIVSAPRVCGGRPTFKHTRVEVATVLALLGKGRSPEEVSKGYRGRVTVSGIREAVKLAGKALQNEAPASAVQA
jgi:uncharacterized protein (DUF433 family)